MTETYRTIVTKRDTRAFDGRSIPDDILNRLVQAARMAGSAKAAEPVRLILVRDQAQKDALAQCGRFTPHIPTCAVAAVFVLVPEFGEVGAPFTIFRGPFDAGRAAQNLMLAAWAEGIASCPASMHDEERARAVLGLPPGHVVANV
ncbi:MAG TPA: nitroreductase family protein, partial [Tepidiformaceae bacterium]|nr:nitroreductase family protein [Tepidiformaceae bacterium]